VARRLKARMAGLFSVFRLKSLQYGQKPQQKSTGLPPSSVISKNFALQSWFSLLTKENQSNQVLPVKKVCGRFSSSESYVCPESLKTASDRSAKPFRVSFCQRKSRTGLTVLIGSETRRTAHPFPSLCKGAKRRWLHKGSANATPQHSCSRH
jgi:hypothetical protein